MSCVAQVSPEKLRAFVVQGFCAFYNRFPGGDDGCNKGPLLRNCPEIISTFPGTLPVARCPLPAKAQTVGPLRAAGNVLKCSNYFETTPKYLPLTKEGILIPTTEAVAKALKRREPRRTRRAQRRAFLFLSGLRVLRGSWLLGFLRQPQQRGYIEFSGIDARRPRLRGPITALSMRQLWRENFVSLVKKPAFGCHALNGSLPVINF